MKRQALAVVLGLLALPVLAEPYRPLPRYPLHRVKERAAGARTVQQSPAPAPVTAIRSARQVAGTAQPSSDEVFEGRAAHGEGVPATARASEAEVAPAELKISVGQGSDGGHLVMLVEDPSGARIELTLDEGGRLLAVRPASSRSAEHR